MAKSKATKKAPKKGVAGKGTGTTARKAIAKARKKGSTTKDIAKSARRDESTISAIEAGVIKNPPANLAKNVAKSKASSNKTTKKTSLNKKKALASKKKHN